MVIISASGMATGGRVLHHLGLRTRPRNTILLRAFQAGGTRGASWPAVQAMRIFGQDVPVRAEVASSTPVRARRCRRILAWLQVLFEAAAQVFVTHGEPDAADALRLRIEHELGWPCRMPEYLETVTLD